MGTILVECLKFYHNIAMEENKGGFVYIVDYLRVSLKKLFDGIVKSIT